MKQAIQQAKRLIDCASIRALRLVETTAKHCRYPKDSEEIRLFWDHSSKVVLEDNKTDSFIVRVNFRAKVSSAEEDPKPPFETTAVYDILYSVPKDFHPSQEELKSFAESNAIFNAWPYFREYVQSVSARMDLPQVLMPLFRLQPRKEASKAIHPAAEKQPVEDKQKIGAGKV